MDNQPLENWFGYEGVNIGEEQLDFSGFPLWNWQMDYPIEADVIEATPLRSSFPYDPLFPTKDFFQVINEFYSMFDGEIGFWDEMRNGYEPKKDIVIYGEEKIEKTKENNKVENNICREEKAITFEEVSRYFYMPITQAAKELNIGLTLLKKKCRELGIPRWPHRKMKSLQTLIRNVQELREEGDLGEVQLRSAVEILERERKLMEKEPGMQLEEKTKRLRQACFKANYKKRRVMGLDEVQRSSKF